MAQKNLKKILDKVGKDSFLGMCITGFLTCEISKYYKMTVKELYDYKRRQDKYTTVTLSLFFCILAILGAILLFTMFKTPVAIIYTIVFVSFIAYSIYRLIRLRPKNIERLNKEEEQWNEYYRKKQIEEYQNSIHQKIRDIIGDKHFFHLMGCMEEDELTNFYLAEKHISESQNYVPVIMQLDENLLESLPDFLEEVDFNNLPNTSEYVQQAVDKLIKNNTETWDDYTDPMNNNGEVAPLEKLSVCEFGDDLVLIHFYVDHPWEIFKYIAPVGGECAPDPKDNIIFAKHWYEKYNAVPAFIFYDTVYFYVPEPVEPQNCYQLALEHQAYCIESGSDPYIWKQVNSLEKSHFWNFWWD